MPLGDRLAVSIQRGPGMPTHTSTPSQRWDVAGDLALTTHASRPSTDTHGTQQINSFDKLGLSPALLRAVTAEGYTTPTPIQAASIPPVLAGRDVLGCAQTGTGKTAAFSLPILDLLSEDGADRRRGGRRLPRVLILSPTRELATQIADSIRTYGRHTRLKHVVIYGGVSQHRQVRALDAGVDIIVATPGRLMDLMEQGFVDLTEVETFILDEADRMLDMGFIQPIRQIAQSIPQDRQTLLFSATMPASISKLANSLLRDPVRISVTPVASAAPLIDQTLYMVPGEQKAALLVHMLQDAEIESAVVFVRTKHGADRLTKRLTKGKIRAESIHGNKSQNQRQRALDSFRSGQARVLVATDVAARGLDVDGITHVFNFDLPNEPEAYVHRIGRTGRAGATGFAISFCSREERGFLRSIERLVGERMTPTEMPSDFEYRNANANANHGAVFTSGHTPGSRPAVMPRHTGHDRRAARDSRAGYTLRADRVAEPKAAPRGSKTPRPEGSKPARVSRSILVDEPAGQPTHAPRTNPKHKPKHKAKHNTKGGPKGGRGKPKANAGGNSGGGKGSSRKLGKPGTGSTRRSAAR